MFNCPNFLVWFSPPSPSLSHFPLDSYLLPIHVVDTNLDGSAVGFQGLGLGELHDGVANVSQTLGRQVGAGDVLDEGGEVDSGVLLGKSVRSCIA